jgi:hypothetical protein
MSGLKLRLQILYMNINFLSFVLVIVVLFQSCSSSISEETEKNTNDSLSTSNLSSNLSNSKLIGEWILDSIDNNKTMENMNIIFKTDNTFSIVSSAGTVPGTFTLSDDNKKISLKSDKSDDTWNVLNLTDSTLTVFDNSVNQAEYKFKK